MTGRGRGNFKPSANNDNKFKNTGTILSQLTNLQGPRGANFEDAEAKKVNVATKYDEIESNICKLNASDDGILLNQKYKYIIELFEKLCQTPDDTIDALNIIYRRGLYDAAFASKFVSMLSSLSFSTLKIQNVKIRSQFIGKLQEDFENCQVLQAKSPVAFRNSVRMLGEFYHKARFSGGGPIQIFTKPLCKYLEMLLESGDEENMELFTTQLYMNGNGLKNKLPEDLSEIIIQIRHVLATNNNLTATSKLWLLLAIDVSNYNFRLLPTELEKFYISKLGEKVSSQFDRISGEWTIQNIQKEEIEQVVNNVSNLKVDMAKLGGGDSIAEPPRQETPKSSYDNDGPKPSYNREKYLVKANTYKKISPEGTPNWEQGKREMRPILGVGARLNKVEKKNEDWRERNEEWQEIKSDLNPNVAGWNNMPRSGGNSWGGDESGGGKKSWSQHDDRTETDYT